MHAFQVPALSDRNWVLSLLRAEGLPLCDYSFPVLYCWQDAYRFKLARLGGRLLIRLHSSLGHSYLWPAGEGDPTPALQILARDAEDHDEPLRLIALTLYHKNWLAAHFPGRFIFEENRDSFDYLYTVGRLAQLPGKKLHAKRNHLHRFDQLCPGWSFTPLTQADIPGCLTMDQTWHASALTREEAPGLSSLAEEQRALRLALDHWQALGLEGGVLRWQGDILGFTLGAPLTETVFDVHFERARSDIQGAYAAVNRSFARQIAQLHPQVHYLNREDDMGIAGLRKAKLSYYPDDLEVKFCAVASRAAPR